MELKEALEVVEYYKKYLMSEELRQVLPRADLMRYIEALEVKMRYLEGIVARNKEKGCQ